MLGTVSRITEILGKNAWCMDVIQPLLRLAIEEDGSGEWILQSVYVDTFKLASLVSCHTLKTRRH